MADSRRVRSTGWLLRSAMAFKIYSTRRMAKMIVTDYYKLITRNY